MSPKVDSYVQAASPAIRRFTATVVLDPHGSSQLGEMAKALTALATVAPQTAHIQINHGVAVTAHWEVVL